MLVLVYEIQLPTKLRQHIGFPMDQHRQSHKHFWPCGTVLLPFDNGLRLKSTLSQNYCIIPLHNSYSLSASNWQARVYRQVLRHAYLLLSAYWFVVGLSTVPSLTFCQEIAPNLNLDSEIVSLCCLSRTRNKATLTNFAQMARTLLSVVFPMISIP